MNVTVFGATGAIGRLTVTELLQRGHAVTAYARTLDKVPAEWGSNDRVRVVIGEMSDAEAIDSAVEGADVVVSALGPSMKRKATGLPLVDGVRHILDSMRTHHVHRYIGHATPSILDPHEKPTRKTRFSGFMARTFRPRAHEEITGMSTLIMDSDVNWTIVRFLSPRNGRKREIRVGYFGRDKLGMAVGRADIAAFTAGLIDDDKTYFRRLPAITN